jgi:hypothetical protein
VFQRLQRLQRLQQFLMFFLFQQLPKSLLQQRHLDRQLLQR